MLKGPGTRGNSRLSRVCPKVCVGGLAGIFIFRPRRAEAGRKASAEAEREAREALRPGRVFRDCNVCPEMVVVPAGSFTMGSPFSEEDRFDDEGPPRRVTISEPFAVGRYEVTFAEWDACVAAGGCNGYRPDDRGWSRGQRPAINVNWDDAQAYVAWLSRETGERYRLLSEAEWEYATRAETQTRYHWGDSVVRNRANCDGCGSRLDNDRTAPVGSFPANGFRLHDMHGNVWEWVEDCWHGSYDGAPSEGSAWTRGAIVHGAFFAAVPGSMGRGASAPRAAAGSAAETASTTAASALPGRSPRESLPPYLGGPGQSPRSTLPAHPECGLQGDASKSCRTHRWRL